MSAGFGHRARVSIGVRTVLGAVLAVGAAVLAIDLADWKYARFDLSVSGRNTLDEAVLDIVDRLPEPVVVDVFYRGLERPYDAVSQEVAGRLNEVLRVAMESRRDLLRVRFHDLADVAGARARQQELGVEGVNFVLFSNESGTRRARQELFGDVAVVDWGHPNYPDGVNYLLSQGIEGAVSEYYDPRAPFAPARVAAFRGEEVLARSLLKVSTATAPRVYVSSGQGEPSLEEADPGALSALKQALEEDDFEVLPWVPLETPEVPADCDVLALLGPTQPYPEGTLDRVQAWVRAGGRLVLAPALSEVEAEADGGVVELMGRFGMVPHRGIVCEPLPTAGGLVEGDQACAVLEVHSGLSPSDDFTAPLRQRQRRVTFQFTSGLRVVHLEGGGTAYSIVRAGSDAWIDRPVAPGRYDFRRERGEWTERKEISLIARANPAVDQALVGGEVKDAIVLGIGGVTFASNALLPTNRDFLLNAFNVLGERDYRVRVSPLARPEGRLDLAAGHALPVLTWTLYLAFPGLAVLTGLFLAVRRRG